ncbi:unnamed protein product, partial [Pylaiella littoralis]
PPPKEVDDSSFSSHAVFAGLLFTPHNPKLSLPPVSISVNEAGIFALLLAGLGASGYRVSAVDKASIMRAPRELGSDLGDPRCRRTGGYELLRASVLIRSLRWRVSWKSPESRRSPCKTSSGWGVHAYPNHQSG